MVEHVIGGHARVHAEILWQISEGAPKLLRLGDDVDITESNCSFRWGLQRRDGTHQCRLARAVRAEQPVHASWNGERHVIESTRSIRVYVADLLKAQHVLLSRVAVVDSYVIRAC